MGKTAQPFCFVLTEPEMLTWPKFVELAAKGHTLITLDTLLENRLVPPVETVFGARAHYLQADMEKYVDVALKGARARKKAQSKPA